jgi:hypothetical protein
MVTLEQIRSIANELPGVNEGMHFRLPTFKLEIMDLSRFRRTQQ